MLRSRVWKETAPEEIKKQIEEAARKDNTITFTGGGEPSTLADLPNFISYARSLGIRDIGIETNGMLLKDAARVRVLKESGMNFCVISLHSYIPEVSDRITQTPGGFNQTIEGIKTLLEEDIPIRHVLHTITEWNYRHIKEFFAFMYGTFAIDEFSVGFIRPIKGDKKSMEATPRLTDVMPYLHDALSFCRERGIRVGISSGLGVPLCFLKGFEEFSKERSIYLTEGKEAHEKASYAYEKIKGDQCAQCSMDNGCSGVNKNYAEMYGTSELAPFKENGAAFIRLEPTLTNDALFDSGVEGDKDADALSKKNVGQKKHNLGRIQINRDCNQRCVFCSAPPTGGQLPFEEVKSRMVRLKEEGATDLMITGGEPTLKKDLFEILELAQQLGFEEITIQTNGSTLNREEFLQKLCTIKNFKFNISFHASDELVFGELSKAPWTYKNTINGIKLLGKYGISAFFTIVIQSSNYKGLKDHIAFCRKNFPHITHYSFNFIDPVYNAKENPWTVPTFTQAEPFIKETFQFIKDNACTFRIEKIPLCFIGGFEEYHSDLRRGVFDETRINAFYRVKGDLHPDDFYTEKRSNFTYSPKCDACSIKTICPGINNNYISIHGMEEIRPVHGKDPKDIILRMQGTRSKLPPSPVSHVPHSFMEGRETGSKTMRTRGPTYSTFKQLLIDDLELFSKATSMRGAEKKIHDICTTYFPIEVMRTNDPGNMHAFPSSKRRERVQFIIENFLSTRAVQRTVYRALFGQDISEDFPYAVKVLQLLGIISLSEQFMTFNGSDGLNGLNRGEEESYYQYLLFFVGRQAVQQASAHQDSSMPPSVPAG